MGYQLKYSKNAAKEISKLDNLVKKKIKEAIETKLLTDPLANSLQLQDFEVKGARRLRVGNYRVIFYLENNIQEILRVGHRRDIYKS
ncbi:MAG: type II toxin-antitoxin system RelE/ParE family toxin [Candidatus Woykebacteria bacterium]